MAFNAIVLSTLLMGSQQISATGFELTHETDSAVEYRYKDGKKYLFSKRKFIERADAQAFCPSGKTLINDPLLFIFTGLVQKDGFVSEALTYRFDIPSHTASGIWWWAPKLSPKGDIVFTESGRGLETEIEFLSVLNERLASVGISSQMLPAVCSDK